MNNFVMTLKLGQELETITFPSNSCTIEYDANQNILIIKDSDEKGMRTIKLTLSLRLEQ
jgi:hypothetical protein